MRGKSGFMKPITGYCGANLTFRLLNGVLLITGSGRLEYDNLKSYEDQIEELIISPGCTSIASGSFSFCKHISSVTIPEGVQEIGQCAFMRCDNLTSVTFPGSLKMIGGGTFACCKHLNNIVVSDQNPNFTYKAGALYNKDCTELILCLLGETNFFQIPKEVIHIAASAFSYSALSWVFIPSGVTEISEYAFANCWYL